jgi:hypothetical protein
VFTTLVNLANRNDPSGQWPAVDNDGREVAQKIEDEPSLGLWADHTGNYGPVGFDNFLNANHPPFYLDPGGNPNNFGRPPAQDSDVGRNVLRLGGDVTFAVFDDEPMKFQVQLWATHWLAY